MVREKRRYGSVYRCDSLLLDTETPKKVSEFEFKFYIGSVKYWYILHLDRNIVKKENLYYYKTVQPTMLFSREFKDGQSIIKINQSAIKISNAVLEELNMRCLPNMSFFAARNQVNCSLSLIDEVRDWFKIGFYQLYNQELICLNMLVRKCIATMS